MGMSHQTCGSFCICSTNTVSVFVHLCCFIGFELNSICKIFKDKSRAFGASIFDVREIKHDGIRQTAYAS